MKKFLKAGVAAGVLGLAIGGQAFAQESQDIDALLSRLQSQIDAQAAKLAEQERLLAEQRKALEEQQQELRRLQTVTVDALANARAAGASGAAAPRGPGEASRAALDELIVTRGAFQGPRPADPVPAPAAVAQVQPAGANPAGQITPVGEAPPEAERVEIEALPEGTGVLTPPGVWIWEQSLDYTHGSRNRLVFRGVEIVTGINIGVIEASDADRNALSAASALRFGLTDRIEVEARIPYVYRSDRLTVLTQADEAATRSLELEGKDVGDIELSGRYQLNRALPGRPVYIANLRVKTDTGTSPFEIPRDEFGVSVELPTGSGFWAVEPSLSFIYPTDPAVIFASVGYLWHMDKDVDRLVGSGDNAVFVGNVDPGDSYTAAAGFGFALNPRFSFSLGYKHAYITPTRTELGATRQKSESLQVGAFTFGWSFRLTERMTFSNGYEIGTTSDAPDMRVVFRLPIRFQ